VRVSTFLGVVGAFVGLVGDWVLGWWIAWEVDEGSCGDLPCGPWSSEIILVGALMGGLVAGIAGWLVGRWLGNRS
jgi:hypothetical protein